MADTTLIVHIRAMDEGLASALHRYEDAFNRWRQVADRGTKEVTLATRTLDKVISGVSSSTERLRGYFNSLRTVGVNTWDTIRQRLSNFVTNIPVVGTTLNTLSSSFRTVGESIRNTWTTAMEHIRSGITSVVGEDRWSSMVSSVNSATTQITGTFSSAFDHIRSIAGQVGGTLGQTISDGIRNAASGIDSALSTISTKLSSIGQVGSQGLKTLGSGLRVVKDAASSVSQAFTGLSSTTSQMLGLFGAANFGQMTAGLSLSRDKMTALASATMGTQVNIKGLMGGLDEMTNHSVVSMDMMIQAMNKSKMSSGLTAEKFAQLTTGVKQFSSETGQCVGETGKLNDVMMKLGEAALLMGDDMGHAQFVMSDALDGLNGNFRTLQMNLGITKEKLLDAGWSGASTDVDGYLNALEKVTDEMGDTSAVMNTTAGKLEVVKKQFRVAGRQIGDSFKPAMDWVLDSLISLNEDGNMASKTLLYMHGGFSMLSGVVPTVTQTFAPFGEIVHILSNMEHLTNLLTFATELSTLASQINSGAEVENSIAKQASAIAADEEALANLGLAGSLQMVASAAWELTVALLTNPWTWVVVAVIGLVLVLWHLYNTNEQVRETFNKWFAILKGKGIQALNGLKAIAGQVWQGLKVLGGYIYQMLIPAWNTLKTQLQPLKQAFMELWNTVLRLWGVLTQTTGATDETGKHMNTLAVIGKVLGAIILGIAQVLIWAVQIVTAILIPIITHVVNKIRIVINVITGIINVLVQVSNGTLNWGQALQQIGMIILNGFIQWITSLGQMLWSIVDNLLGVAGTSLSEVGKWLGDMINTTVQGLNQWVISGVDSAIEFVGGIINQISQLPGQFWTWLWGIINGFLEWRSQLYQEAWNAGMDVLNGFIQWVTQLPMQFWTLLWGAITSFLEWRNQIQMEAWNAGMGFLTTFINWIMQVPMQVWTWLWTTLNNFWNWRNQVIQEAIHAGSQFLQNLINYLMNLPSRVWSILQNVIQKVISWASSFVEKAKNAAKDAVTGHDNNFKNIKDKVVDALNKVIDAVKQWAKDFVSKVAQAGKDAVNGIWGAISGAASGGGGGGTSSAVLEDFTVASDAISNSSLPDEVAQLGDEMSSSFAGSFEIASSSMSTVGEMSSMMSSVTVSAPSVEAPSVPETGDIPSMTPQLNSEQMGEDSQGVTQSITEMSVLSTEQLNLMNMALQGLSLQSTNNLLTTQANNLQTIFNYQQMVMQVNTQLTNLQNMNALHWTQIKTKTETDLKEMLSTTKSVTQQMIEAWNVMKDSIVKSAEEIKSQSETRFNNLWNTIKTFYHNIQHPGGAGSPSGGRRPSRSTSGSAVSRFKNAINSGVSQSMPKTKKLSYINLVSDYGFSPQDMSYIMPTDTATKKIPIDYITKWLNGEKVNGGAGWEGIIKPNYDWIRNTSNEWDMAGPVILGKYSTDPGFKVKQFENGAPTIDYGTFKKMAEDVFSQCHYEFYWDSERYGSWQAAAYNGGMNCSDSSDFLIAMAHACGLSASKVHGHWNQFGHFWAEVEGHKMDTTGWMQRRDWTPAASHAGSPSRDPFSKLASDINNGSSNSNVSHTGSVDLVIKHEFVNLPDSLGRNDVENILRESFDDRRFIKQLISNPDFQELDKKMKMNEMKKQGRYYGV